MVWLFFLRLFFGTQSYEWNISWIREKVIFPKENEDVDRLLLFLLSTMSTLQVVKISIFVLFLRDLWKLFLLEHCVWYKNKNKKKDVINSFSLSFMANHSKICCLYTNPKKRIIFFHASATETNDYIFLGNDVVVSIHEMTQIRVTS